MFRSPQIASRIVVLPSPVLPIRTAYWPVETANETFDRRNEPERIVTSSSWTMGRRSRGSERKSGGVAEVVLVSHATPLLVSASSFQMRHHKRHIGRRNAANAGGLSQRHGPHAIEFFTGFEA